MSTSYVFNSVLFQKLCSLELAVLVLTALLETLMTPLSGPLFLSRTLIVSLYMLLTIGVLSRFPPIHGSGWLRLLYMLLQLVLAFAASILGVYRLFPLLFIVLVAKGALILPLRGLVTLLLFTSVTHIVVSQWRPTFVHEQLLSPQSPSLLYSLVLRSEGELFMVVALALVAIMARTLISEQESRQQVEQLAKEVESLAAYQERSRIAREIHDSLGHTLTSLNIQLDVARKLQARDSLKSREALDTAKNLARQSLADVRDAVTFIVREDTQLDLCEALPELVRQVEQNQSVKVTLSLEPVKLTSMKSHHLYCIVRECLTNAQRHAKASNIIVALTHAADRILVEIKDDGEGFDPETISRGFGISGMRQRAEHLGGTLTIDSSPGVGTQIRVTVPG